MWIYEFLSQLSPFLIKNCTSRGKKGTCHKVYVMAKLSVLRLNSFSLWAPAHKLYWIQDGHKGKTHSIHKTEFEGPATPSLLNPLYSLAGILQTKCPHFFFPSLYTSKLREGILISAWHRTGKKHLFIFTCLLVPHLTHDFWQPSAEEEEGNDAPEPVGPCTSQYKHSHSRMNDSMGVSRSLVINNPQYKSVTSTSLRGYLSDVGAIESSYQKSLVVSKVLPKGWGVDTENVQSRCGLNA